MAIIALVVFLVTYAGIALGRVPGLMLDRTGIALLGAIGMIITGVLSLSEAVRAVDFPTILLLYALMVVSAQLRLGGFYTWVVLRTIPLLERPRLYLLATMFLSAFLSAILANDIICLAFTPVLAVSLLRAGLNPVPFLLGLALSSNIGSAATIIGNPQNMLIGQIGQLGFGPFLSWCAPPAVISLGVAYGLMCFVYRSDLRCRGAEVAAPAEPAWPAFNSWQSTKGLAATGVLVALFFTSIPRELSSIAIAGVLLCSRKMESRHILGLVDWHLITLFCGLFVVIEAIARVGLPSTVVEGLTGAGIELGSPVVLTAVSALLSNLVSNVPATMLLTRFLDPSMRVQWYTLAVSSTFAGNLIVIGSIANLIVIEQARSYGIAISFGEHARIGIPVTLTSLLILVGWLWVMGT